MRRVFWSTLSLGLLLVSSVESVHAAPQQLLNKTISWSYTVQSMQRDPDGKTRGVQTGINYTVYVSGAGRLFERSSRSAGGKTQGGDQEVGARQTKIGEARDIHFEGNKLVSVRGYVTGAARTIVSFDPNFSSCTVDLLMGRENGLIKRKMIDGVTREILSSSMSGQSCSIRQGNAFAN
jgi:hypothetical protein